MSEVKSPRMEDQRQEAPQACATCTPLTLSTDVPVSKLHLRASAQGGCAVCEFFWKACTVSTDVSNIDQVRAWSANGGVYGLSMEKELPDNHVVGDKNMPQVASVVTLAANGEKGLSLFPWIPTVAKSPFSRTRARDIKLIKTWLQDCQDNHEFCRQGSPPLLPTRIINVGGQDREPYLIINKRATGKYLALSHRWGGVGSPHKMLTTTKMNLLQHCSAIPTSKLPLTFREAIDVTRALGILYLWIDSLCIIQDDIQDWEKESSAMGDIYTNAYATLFAERAAHSDDGLFPTAQEFESQKQWVREIDYYNPTTKQQQWVLISSGLAHYPRSSEEAFCLVDKACSHLQNRGWIMQEEILSRRKICFSQTELHWQCNSISQCECGLRSIALASSVQDPTAKLLYTHGKDGGTSKGLSLSHSRRMIRDERRAWKRLVTVYTTRRLTDERDRLTALAGIASKQEKLTAHYLAGIWRLHAEEQLLWHARSGDHPCHRHQDRAYYAPTWSWASVTGAVEFHPTFKPHGTIFRDVYMGLVLWSLVDGKCYPSGQNPMGPVSSGWLKIKGKVASVNVEEVPCNIPAGVEKQWEKGDYTYRMRDGNVYELACWANAPVSPGANPQNSDDGIRISAGVSAAADRYSVLRLDAPEDWEDITDAVAGQYLFLIAGTEVHSMGAELGNAIGLLIRESKRQSGVWERVCMLRSHASWKDWDEFAYDAEILLH